MVSVDATAPVETPTPVAPVDVKPLAPGMTAVHKPAVQLRITWQDACACITEGTVESLARLQRSPEAVEVYRQAMGKIKEEYTSTADYLRITVFGAPAAPGPDGKLVADALPNTPHDTPRLIWRLNDFPYNFEEGIEHHLLWSTRALTEGEIMAARSQRFPGRTAIHWVNPTPLQSVPTIWHAHVLVKD